jgi:hypothetical protein
MEWGTVNPSSWTFGFALTVSLRFGTVLSFLKHQSEMLE